MILDRTIIANAQCRYGPPERFAPDLRIAVEEGEPPPVGALAFGVPGEGKSYIVLLTDEQRQQLVQAMSGVRLVLAGERDGPRPAGT